MRRRLGERFRTRSGISRNRQQIKGNVEGRGLGGNVCENGVAAEVTRLKVNPRLAYTRIWVNVFP